MRVEITAILALAGIGYLCLQSVNRTMDEFHQSMNRSAQLMDLSDKRIERVEAVMAEVPKMRGEIAEIKRMLGELQKRGRGK